MDFIRPKSHGYHHHAEVIYVLPNWMLKKGARVVWHSVLGPHHLSSNLAFKELCIFRPLGFMQRGSIVSILRLSQVIRYSNKLSKRYCIFLQQRLANPFRLSTPSIGFSFFSVLPVPQAKRHTFFKTQHRQKELPAECNQVLAVTRGCLP